jgi:hypothetical protein
MIKLPCLSNELTHSELAIQAYGLKVLVRSRSLYWHLIMEKLWRLSVKNVEMETLKMLYAIDTI